ncbi:DEAD/DEAH box helicase, partial [Escherichia coli]|uniref:DEAD/DEAH box helicase n=1 Tax=Escherichia coli TaxID=562 RepID=UPI0028E07087
MAAMGFTRPTTIQQMVLEPALDGRDILASAPTGTGKTAAFLLPALQHLLDFPRRKPGPCRMLVLTPTRELALQVTAHAKALAA